MLNRGSMRSAWLPKMILQLSRRLACEKRHTAGTEAELTSRGELDQPTGQLGSSRCLALCRSRSLHMYTGWGLKAHMFEFPGDFLTALRAS